MRSNRAWIVSELIAKEPPVSVRSKGRVDLITYIKQTLPDVYSSADSHHLSLIQLQDMVEDHISWITKNTVFKSNS